VVNAYGEVDHTAATGDYPEVAEDDELDEDFRETEQL
jgi:hypothetical protein